MLTPIVVESMNARCEVKSVNCEVSLRARPLCCFSGSLDLQLYAIHMAKTKMLSKRVVDSVSDYVVSFGNGLMHFG